MNARDSVPCLVVLTTLASVEDARSLVRRLVTDRIAACGTIVEHVLSIYRWQGNLEETPEVMVILKTRQDRWETLQSTVRELHPYDVPELLALPVEAGLPAYLEWLAGETVEMGEES